ncbi:MAG TPA: phosphatase PAP2 family protein [Candidatus Saccharimonadales bacterium]|nr:phosphatase PAP2 family protein [Candidatus Saccharimonadales bacterium]
MKISKPNSQNLLLLLALVVVTLGYFVVNRPIGHLHVLNTSIDKHISFLPVFIIPYLLFLPIFWLVILYAFLTDKSFKSLALTILIVYLASYLIYALFQTYVPRPMAMGQDIFSKLVRLTYRIDKPYNGFPSGHASSAAIMASYFIFTNHRCRWLFTIFGLLVVVSTLFVKQHFILDAISGVLLGAGVSWLVFRYIKPASRLPSGAEVD